MNMTMKPKALLIALFTLALFVGACPKSGEKAPAEEPAPPVKAVKGKAPAPAPVRFADLNLETCVRNAINKPTGELMTTDLLAIERLDAGGKDMVWISGIENLVNLKHLDLSFDHLKDLGPLARLSKLETLNLEANHISDLTPLAGLTRLKSLNLRFNNVSDLRPLAGLVNLVELILARNHINDLAPLQNLTRLKHLDLTANQVTNLSPLRKNSDQGGFGPGSNIILKENSLDSNALFADIPALQDRGATVVY